MDIVAAFVAHLRAVESGGVLGVLRTALSYANARYCSFLLAFAFACVVSLRTGIAQPKGKV